MKNNLKKINYENWNLLKNKEYPNTTIAEFLTLQRTKLNNDTCYDKKNTRYKRNKTGDVYKTIYKTKKACNKSKSQFF